MLASGVILLYLRKIHFTFGRWQLVGALAYVGTQLFFIAGTKLTTAANVIFLQFTAPLYAVLLGYYFLNEKPNKMDWIAMALILPGMGLFFGDNGLTLNGTYGNVLGILSGISMAIMTVAMRKERFNTPANTILLGNFMAAIIGFPWLLQAPFDLTNGSIMLYLGTIQLGLTFLLYSFAIQRVNAVETILLTSLEPILNPFWVFLILGEVPGPWSILGGTMVLLAVLGRAIASSRTVAE